MEKRRVTPAQRRDSAQGVPQSPTQLERAVFRYVEKMGDTTQMGDGWQARVRRVVRERCGAVTDWSCDTVDDRAAETMALSVLKELRRMRRRKPTGIGKSEFGKPSDWFG